MGCCLTRLEHEVWGRCLDQAVRGAPNFFEIIAFKKDFLGRLESIRPRELVPYYDEETGALLGFDGMTLGGTRFTLSISYATGITIH